MAYKNQKISVLFFGRKGDEKSEKCIDHLLDLNFNVKVVWSSKRNETLPEGIEFLKIDYILCYRSYFILPKSLIESAKFYSINFHPGPPNYPGSGGVNFALYNNDINFGVTTHLMNEKIDNGPILSTKYFLIAENDDVFKLLERSHTSLFSLFKEFTTNLKEFGNEYIEKCRIENKHEIWSNLKRTVKDIENYRIIDKEIDEIELLKRIKSFNYKGYPIELKLHGKTFNLIVDK
jgi:methionyl-tRNA formyltransferase